MRLRLLTFAIAVTLSVCFAQTQGGSKSGSTGQQGSKNENKTGSAPKQSDSKKVPSDSTGEYRQGTKGTKPAK